MINTNLFKKSLLLIVAVNLNANVIYNIDELVLKALENSPELQISSYQVDASKERLNTATSGYLPNLNLHLGLGKTALSDVPTNPDDMVDDNLILGSLSLKQIIYDFGKTGGNVDSSKYDSESYFLNNEQAISDKIRDVKLAYYKVLQSLAIIQVNKENVELNKVQLYRSQRYFDAGIRTKIDVSDAKVELIQAKLDLKESEYDLKLAYASLDKVVGFVDTYEPYRVYSQELNINDLYSNLQAYALDLQSSVNHAYQNRFELKKYSANIKSSQAQQAIASSNYYPSIYFNADYTKQEVDKFVNTPTDQWQAAINLDWNIYEGGATSSQTQEKLIQTKISQTEFINAKLLIKDETTQAYINVYKMKDSVELSQSLVEVSKEKFDQAGKRYEHGLSDYIELQQSRQGYIDAMASLVVSYYNYYGAVAVLDNAIGK